MAVNELAKEYCRPTIDIEHKLGMASFEELRQLLQEEPQRLNTVSRIVLNDKEIWIDRLGQEIVRNSDKERETAQDYLAQEAINRPGHYDLVQDIAYGMPLMDINCRVAVLVPAWLEEDNLPRFLAEFEDQLDESGSTINRSFYEINILVNRKEGDQTDNSIKIIKDFVHEHPWGPLINYYDVELPEPFNNVGYARKLLTDATLLRSISRLEQNGCLYIQSEDADTISIDRQQIIKVINKMDSQPHLDALKGQQDRMPEYLMQNDMLFLSCRLRDFLEAIMSRKKYRNPQDKNWNFSWNRIVTGGWNTVFSAEAYALAGGYSSVYSGEDMDLGNKITAVRGDGTYPNLEVIGRLPTRAEGSPRRFINQIKKGKDAYEDFSDENDNLTIRTLSVEEGLQEISHLQRIDSSTIPILNRFAKGLFEDFKDVNVVGDNRGEVMESLMFWLGFEKDDYTIREDGIDINNWDNVRNKIEQYRQNRR